MEGASRSRLVAVITVGGTLGDRARRKERPAGVGRAPGGLRLEPFPGDPAELIVSLEDPALNRIQTTAGRCRVTLDCLDRDDRVVVTGRKAWPFRA